MSFAHAWPPPARRAPTGRRSGAGRSTNSEVGQHCNTLPSTEHLEPKVIPASRNSTRPFSFARESQQLDHLGTAKASRYLFCDDTNMMGAHCLCVNLQRASVAGYPSRVLPVFYCDISVTLLELCFKPLMQLDGVSLQSSGRTAAIVKHSRPVELPPSSPYTFFTPSVLYRLCLARL